MSTRRKFLSQISTATALAGISPMISACCSFCKDKAKAPFKLGVADWTLKLGGDPKSFDKAKEIVSRTKSSGCIVFNSDLESLKK